MALGISGWGRVLTSVCLEEEESHNRWRRLGGLSVEGWSEGEDTPYPTLPRLYCM